MATIEDYTARAAESLAAAAAAPSERERIFHTRAHAVWRRLIAGVGEAEQRAAMQPPRRIEPLKQPVTKPGFR